MTIQALDASLRGGFHDALLHSYSVDLVAKTVRFTLDLCVGDPDSDDASVREAYRKADVILTGVEYFVSEMPDPKYPRTAPMMIDLCSADSEVVSRLPTPHDGFAARIYSSDTNAFIHFAARDAQVAYHEEV